MERAAKGQEQGKSQSEGEGQKGDLVMMNLRAVRAAALVASVALPSAALSQDRPEFPKNTRAVTAQDIQTAAPHRNTLSAPDASQAQAERLSSGLVPGGTRTSAGSATRDSRAYGSFGIPYTSTRVTTFGGTGSGASFLSTTYPYRTIGRFTFTNYSGGNSLCSASLIRRSVLVTAAHCVSAFGNNTLYTNFRFTPGSYAPTGATLAQIQPYGVWGVRILVRPSSWRLGTDTGSGSARNNDLAVFIVAKNASNQFIGDIVGYLGYGWNNPSFVSSSKTGNLSVAATTTLGYPALLDAGRIMQRADGPTYPTVVSNALQLWQGNNFTGGSSGGPWIVNFGAQSPVFSGGASAGSFSGMWVVGVTSWGSADPNTPKDNYSSRFGQNTQYPNANYGGRGAGNVASILTTLCNATVAGTTQSYAQQGYCN
jgi:hypothetical protein